MNKKEEKLLKYIADCAEVGRLEKEISESNDRMEKLDDDINRLEDSGKDPKLVDIYCNLYNYLTKKVARMTIKKAEAEIRINMFILHSLEED